MAGPRVTLHAAGSVMLDGIGAGQIALGPGSSAGPPIWHVTGVIVQTDRPGTAPIPRIQFYRDEVIPENSLGLSYDGSFGQGSADETLTRGQLLIASWTGGQAGDRATFVVTGEKWA